MELQNELTWTPQAIRTICPVPKLINESAPSTPLLLFLLQVCFSRGGAAIRLGYIVPSSDINLFHLYIYYIIAIFWNLNALCAVADDFSFTE
jgi:hypothetical protein